MNTCRALPTALVVLVTLLAACGCQHASAEKQARTDASPAISNQGCDGCLIDGVCRPERTRNPENECEACIAAQNPNGWSAVPDRVFCDDGILGNGFDWCMKGKCAGHTDQNDPDVCNNNGLFCDGYEVYDPDTDSCVSMPPPCPRDNIVCNGFELCEEKHDKKNPGYECVALENCADNKYFCDGVEYCDPEEDRCKKTGSPCKPDEVCDEENDKCLPAAPLTQP